MRCGALLVLRSRWGRRMRRALGAEPLYSTAWQNAASRAVARTLGVALYGTDLRIA